MEGRRRMLERFRIWDDRVEVIKLSELIAALDQLELCREDLGDAVGFDDRGYRRATVHRTAHYEALVLCWKSGQSSPIHNHRGSSCAVKVVEGCATETRYKASPCGRLVPVGSERITAGSVTGCRGEGTHQMANLEPAGKDLVTFHVYSPPPSDWCYFSLDQTSLADHDRLMNNRPATVFVDLGHKILPAPKGRKLRRPLPWTS